jgi:hypothetical protein
MSTSTKKITKGKRYSPEEKQDIISFVQKFNEDNNGRGGQSAASKKYGISQLSVSSWLKSAGSAAPVTGARRGRKPGSLNKPKGFTSSGGSYSAKLGELSSLANQIDKAQADLDKLKAKFQSLKAGL